MAIPKQNVCTHEMIKGYLSGVIAENAPRCPTMVGTYLEVTGCLWVALGVLLGGDMDFKIVDSFVMDLETGFTLVLVNVNGLGGGGRRDGSKQVLPSDVNT